MAKYVDRLPLKSPGEMSDLYDVSFDEILDVLEALGEALDFDTNPHLQEAYEASLVANVLPPEMMRNSYQVLRPLFTRQNVLEVADTQVGLDYLNGWVPQRLSDGRELRVRAFGSRVLHIPAGNGGLVSAVTILRSVIARCDTIIKAPSNDPLTADRHRPHPRRRGARPSDHQAPGGRLLEGRRRRGRGGAVPAAAHRKDRRLGRIGLGQARHPLHPARPGADRARPQAQRHHHRRRGVHRRGHHARSRAAGRHRYRRRQPGGLRQRAGDLHALRAPTRPDWRRRTSWAS